MIRRPPTSTLFPTRRSSDLGAALGVLQREVHLAPAVALPQLVDLALHPDRRQPGDRKSTRLNSSHRCISYAVFCLKKKILRTMSFLVLHSDALYIRLHPLCL